MPNNIPLNVKPTFTHASIIGDDKNMLIKALEFFLQHSYDAVNAFFIDKHGYLVFCDIPKNTNPNLRPLPNAILYPILTNPIILAEHIYQYLEGLSPEMKNAMGAIPDDSVDHYVDGWELFTPDCHSEEHGIDNYHDGITFMAVKPFIVEL